MDAWKLSVVLAILFGLGELFSPSFGALGMAVGMLAVAATQFFQGGLDLNRDLLVFAFGSALAFLVFRAAFRRNTDQQKLRQDDINQY
jgi:membrane protein implicated in regulation of membrane protease activity